ncbi:hypothetical protein, partial [Paraburkholderia caledonica]|uniref:hypothetical protein n=1 Tax=Paraburkholderia caledonica TaxID=134536 RepID=UPI003C81EE2E
DAFTFARRGAIVLSAACVSFCCHFNLRKRREPSCLCDGRANFVLMDALARIETHPESPARIARARRGIRVALKAFHAACEEIVTQFSLRV